MKLRLLSAFLMLVSLNVQAEDNPILFTVGDMLVTRSEFEQSYLKNTTVCREGLMTVADYLDLYIAYKLKVKAALDAHIETTSSFKQVYSQCLEDWPTTAAVPSGEFLETTVVGQPMNIGVDEAIYLSQIWIRVPQKVSREKLQEAQEQINNIYQEVQSGAEFDQIVSKYSQGMGPSSVSGLKGWYAHGQMLQEVEDVVFGLQEGEISKPFLSTIGYHIFQVKKHKARGTDGESLQLLPVEKEKGRIYRQVSLVPLSGELLSSVSDGRDDIQVPADGVQRELFEEALLYELNKQSVGRHAAEDEDALKYYFKKNKKKYRRKGFKPKDYTEVRELVVADLQEEMNKHWLVDLRKIYSVYVDKKVLKTVNNHL